MNVAEFSLLHIFFLGIPMLLASIFLLYETIRIEGYLQRYAIQQVLFRGILVVGYLFLLIAIAHLLEHVFAYLGYDDLSMVVETVWHAATLAILAVISYSFYHYRRTLSAAEDVEGRVFK